MAATTTTDHRLAYTVDETAALLGVSRRTVYEELGEGNLATLKIRGRRLVTRAALEAYLADRQREADTGPRAA